MPIQPALVPTPVMAMAPVVATPIPMAPVAALVPSPMPQARAPLPGSCAWQPHPLPHPSIPASVFWGNIPGAVFSGPTSAMSPNILVTGGHPLPGTVPQWVPPAWPPSAVPDSTQLMINPHLIPSPADAFTPQLMWDLAQMPSMAKRLTGNHIYSALGKMEKEQVVFPKAEAIYVTTFFNNCTNWGPIAVKNSSGVTVANLLLAIYNYFQERVTQV
jgi:hypothetical protein